MEKSSKISQKEEIKTLHSDKTDFSSLAEKMLSELPERSREIMRSRFGLTGKEKETLEKIGKNNKITRERVRQIISDAIAKIKSRRNNSDFKQAEESVIFTINGNNGIIRETELIEKLAKGNVQEANAIGFLGNLSDNFFAIEEKGLIEKSWILNENVVEKVKELEMIAREIFNKEKKLFSDEEIIQKISEKNKLISTHQALSHLSVLENIKKNKFKRWGLSSWKEITPKGTRERVYLVLKERGKPLHFTEIASLIDKYQLGKKKAHPQTVHNELIKDERFVLIGRGIYALKEWGYEEGTIKDVLESILRESEKPLGKEEIMEKVLRIRKVKKATVMINLNNPQIFVKVNSGYSVRK